MSTIENLFEDSIIKNSLDDIDILADGKPKAREPKQQKIQKTPKDRILRKQVITIDGAYVDV